MGFRCGIVGLPNVGKSTLFNALTCAGAAAENYPFCTVDPNVGRVAVPEPRLAALAGLLKPQRTVPACMEFVDIAGLVQNASRGEGLGNQFLAHIRETQAIAHVVRCFEDDNVSHVSGRGQPGQDIDIINTELCLADQDSVARAMSKLARRARAGDGEAAAGQSVLQRLMEHLDQARPVRSMELGEQARPILSGLQLITAKPVLYIANVADGAEASKVPAPVLERARREDSPVIPIPARFEAELAQLDAADRQAFLADAGLSASGLERVIRAGYELLGLHTYFTVGPREVRAWTIPRGATALEAAGVIHGDFARGFIRAELASCADYIAHQGEQGVRAAGLWRSEGRDYVVQDGDVILFRFNV